jgi:hypothetical protein
MWLGVVSAWSLDRVRYCFPQREHVAAHRGSVRGIDRRSNITDPRGTALGVGSGSRSQSSGWSQPGTRQVGSCRSTVRAALCTGLSVRSDACENIANRSSPPPARSPRVCATPIEADDDLGLDGLAYVRRGPGRGVDAGRGFSRPHCAHTATTPAAPLAGCNTCAVRSPNARHSGLRHATSCRAALIATGNHRWCSTTRTVPPALLGVRPPA